MKENILILADLEGIIGIYELTDKNICKSFMEKEIKILLDELLARNFNVYFSDIHDDGETTRDLYSLYPAVNFIKCYENIDFSIKYDYAILTGLHAKQGYGILAHSFRSEIKNVFLGEKSVGEIEMYINLLASHGIPTIFVSADNEAMVEIPNCVVSKNVSKGINEDKYEKNYLETKYNKYIINLQKALDNKEKAFYEYNSSDILIELFDSKLLSFLSKKNICIENNLIHISSPEKFHKELLIIADLMNDYIINFCSDMSAKFRKRFANCDYSLINDEKILKLLKLPMYYLNEDSATYLYNKLEEIFFSSK